MEKLREQFQEYVEAGMWQGDDSQTKNFPVGNVSEWWIGKIKEIIKEETDFIQEGISACQEDSKDPTFVGNELHYVFGKSQALKIMKARLLTIFDIEKI